MKQPIIDVLKSYCVATRHSKTGTQKVIIKGFQDSKPKTITGYLEGSNPVKLPDGFVVGCIYLQRGNDLTEGTINLESEDFYKLKEFL